jgi:hypothetical protein
VINSNIRSQIPQTVAKALVLAVIVFGFMFLVFYALDSKPGGLSEAESTYITKTSQNDWGELIKEADFLPHKALSASTQQLLGTNIIVARAVSGLFALFAVTAFYFIVRITFSKTIALVSTLLLFSSSLTLVFGRLVTPEIMYLMTSIPLLGLIMYRVEKMKLGLYVFGVGASLLLYVPGMLWFSLLLLIWLIFQPKFQDTKYSAKVTHKLLTSLLSIVLIAPLIISLYLDPGQLLSLIGVPADFGKINDILISFVQTPVVLTIRSFDNPAFWIGRLPLLDVAQSIFLVFGLALAVKHRVLLLGLLPISGIILGSALAALNSNVPLIVIWPFVFLMITQGISLMSERWQYVFPRNPLARSLGLIAISLVLLASITFNLNRHFIAWVKAPETQQIYSDKSLN